VAIWYILWPFGIFYCHLVYFVAIWYILLSFGIYFSYWYVAPRKIWQSCLQPGSEFTCQPSNLPLQKSEKKTGTQDVSHMGMQPG
jgi:hypothetical protein